jgi:hypothetical protein
MHCSKECAQSYLSIGISNLLQTAQAEVVLGQLSTYLASWGGSRQKKERLEVRRILDIESLGVAVDKVHYIIILLLHSWSTPQ